LPQKDGPEEQKKARQDQAPLLSNPAWQSKEKVLYILEEQKGVIVLKKIGPAPAFGVPGKAKASHKKQRQQIIIVISNMWVNDTASKKKKQQKNKHP